MIQSLKSINSKRDLYVLVCIEPPLRDIGELSTIIGNSFRVLFGEYRYHAVEVVKLLFGTNGSEGECDSSDAKRYAIIQTDQDSVDNVCAALTFAIPPSFMNQNYRIDVLQIESQLKHLKIDFLDS